MIKEELWLVIYPAKFLVFTKFIIDRGATVSVMLTRTHYRRSLLVKGGLEIPCKVSVSMRRTCLNLLLLERYKQLNEKLCIEPKEETVLGSFLTSVQEPERPNAKSKKSWKNAGIKWKHDQQPLPLNDIINHFGAQQRIVDNGNNRKENDKEPCIIVIDKINAKKHCLLNHNMVLFHFPPFFSLWKHRVSKNREIA